MSIDILKCCLLAQIKQFAVIISDVTERKKAEQEIRYLSYHDYLTGLHNRRFYERGIGTVGPAGQFADCPDHGRFNGLKRLMILSAMP